MRRSRSWRVIPTETHWYCLCRLSGCFSLRMIAPSEFECLPASWFNYARDGFPLPNVVLIFFFDCRFMALVNWTIRLEILKVGDSISDWNIQLFCFLFPERQFIRPAEKEAFGICWHLSRFRLTGKQTRISSCNLGWLAKNYHFWAEASGLDVIPLKLVSRLLSKPAATAQLVLWVFGKKWAQLIGFPTRLLFCIHDSTIRRSPA